MNPVKIRSNSAGPIYNKEEVGGARPEICPLDTTAILSSYGLGYCLY